MTESFCRRSAGRNLRQNMACHNGNLERLRTGRGEGFDAVKNAVSKFAQIEPLQARLLWNQKIQINRIPDITEEDDRQHCGPLATPLESICGEQRQARYCKKSDRAGRKLNRTRITRQRGYDVCTVNAFAIRDLSEPDEEFTNFATHADFPEHGEGRSTDPEGDRSHETSWQRAGSPLELARMRVEESLEAISTDSNTPANPDRGQFAAAQEFESVQ